VSILSERKFMPIWKMARCLPFWAEFSSNFICFQLKPDC
jgi:hypothetical protein